MKNYNRSAAAALLSAAMLLCTACGADKESSVSSSPQTAGAPVNTEVLSVQDTAGTQSAESADSLRLTVGSKDFSVTLEDNSTVSALKELLPLTLDMSELNGNEKYYYLDTKLPSAPKKVGSISTGDVMLYGDNCLVVFYKSFDTSYSYTKIGHIDDTAELEDALGSSSVTVSFTADTDGSGDNDSNILVACFSRTGNTEKIAGYLTELSGADSYFISAAVPYTDADIKYQDDSCRANKEQNDRSVRPEIASPIASIDSYDTIFLGYPIWWGEEPRIIDTFLESYDFSGKTVIPFCTSGSSGISRSEANIKALVPIGTQLEGKRFTASASKEEVAEWFDTLDIKKKLTEYTMQDVKNLSSFLLGRPTEEALTDKNYDLTGDGRWDVFDLCMMKRKLAEHHNAESVPVPEGMAVLMHIMSAAHSSFTVSG